MNYLIPECNYHALAQNIEKLNKRAKRLKVEPVVLQNLGVDHIRHEVLFLCSDASQNKAWVPAAEMGSLKPSATITGRTMNWLKIEVSGETPKLNGWSLISILEPLETEDGVENLVRTIPGHECPAEFRSRIGQCDHCRQQRNRKETFVVKHDDGTFKCVGRQCLKDFLGYHGEPDGFAAAAELLWQCGELASGAEDEEFFGGGSRAERCFLLSTLLEWTASVIRHVGWKSRSAARAQLANDATADRVLWLLVPPNPMFSEWQKSRQEYQPIPEDAEKAEAAIEWILNLKELDSDYLYNCNLAARCGSIKYNMIGIACSILVAYDKAMQREIQYQKAQKSEWQGTIGKRQEFTLTCLQVFSSEGSFGITGIHKLVDDDGNQFTWFASGSTEWMEPNEKALVKGTVKKHDEYRGIKQTVLSRVKILQRENAHETADEIREVSV